VTGDPYRDLPHPADLPRHSTADDDDTRIRRVRLTPATHYKIRRVRWLWDSRLPCGSLSLLAGREGLGKSTLAYWLVACVTRGTLPGEFHGTPRSVIICATEDAWEFTIVPRLIAAGADLARVFNVEVELLTGMGTLTLPADVEGIADAALEVDASLMLLDPLMSRLSGKLDSHRDGEVRQALEPLTGVAERADVAILGLMHLNKAGGADPLNAVMGSRAFGAVARTVSLVVPDPDDPEDRRRLFGTPKNNLASTDQPLLAFTIGGATVEGDDGTEVPTSRIVWGDAVEGSVRDAMARAGADPEDRSAVDEAGDWLADWLALQGGEASSKAAKAAGRIAGHSETSLKRAVRKRPDFAYRSQGMPRETIWTFVPAPAPTSRAHARARAYTQNLDLTDPTVSDQGFLIDPTGDLNGDVIPLMTPLVGPVGSPGQAPPRARPRVTTPVVGEPHTADLLPDGPEDDD
jgi:hypothetical protein